MRLPCYGVGSESSVVLGRDDGYSDKKSAHIEFGRGFGWTLIAAWASVQGVCPAPIGDDEEGDGLGVLVGCRNRLAWGQMIR